MDMPAVQFRVDSLFVDVKDLLVNWRTDGTLGIYEH